MLRRIRNDVEGLATSLTSEAQCLPWPWPVSPAKSPHPQPNSNLVNDASAARIGDPVLVRVEPPVELFVAVGVDLLVAVGHAQSCRQLPGLRGQIP
jgi:hypothetical protein